MTWRSAVTTKVRLPTGAFVTGSARFSPLHRSDRGRAGHPAQQAAVGRGHGEEILAPVGEPPDLADRAAIGPRAARRAVDVGGVVVGTAVASLP